MGQHCAEPRPREQFLLYWASSAPRDRMLHRFGMVTGTSHKTLSKPLTSPTPQKRGRGAGRPGPAFVLWIWPWTRRVREGEPAQGSLRPLHSTAGWERGGGPQCAGQGEAVLGDATREKAGMARQGPCELTAPLPPKPEDGASRLPGLPAAPGGQPVPRSIPPRAPGRSWRRRRPTARRQGTRPLRLISGRSRTDAQAGRSGGGGCGEAGPPDAPGTCWKTEAPRPLPPRRERVLQPSPPRPPRTALPAPERGRQSGGCGVRGGLRGSGLGTAVRVVAASAFRIPSDSEV